MTGAPPPGHESVLTLSTRCTRGARSGALGAETTPNSLLRPSRPRQPNLTPGDDGGDDLYAPEHPAVHVLLLTTTRVAELGLQVRLASIEGLIHLNHEMA